MTVEKLMVVDGPMAARQRMGRFRPRPVRSMVALLSLFLPPVLMGCVSMPDSGPVMISSAGRVDEPRDSHVHVVAVPPRRGESQAEIVQGFLEAVTSDEPDYRTARMYLTAEAARSWDPRAGVVVLEGGYRKDSTQDGDTVLSGTRLGTVDPQGVYRPAGEENQAWSSVFSLESQDGEWRIATPPQGLLLAKDDFRRIYRPVSLDFFALPEPGDTGRQVLVPDPIYLRDRAGLPTVLAQALLRGPTPWLAPVVLPTFPTGTTLAGDVSLVGGTARVPVSGHVLGLSRELRDLMAVQVLATLAQASGVNAVVLVDGNNDEVGEASRAMLRNHDPQANGDAVGYWIRNHRLVRLRLGEGPGNEPRTVPGPFGDGSVALGSVAVSVDGQQAAGVDADGRTLLVAPLDGRSAADAKHVMASTGRLFSPSWDGKGRLWLLEESADRAGVMLVRDTTVQRVEVEGLAGRRIYALKAARDGMRVAVVVGSGDQSSAVMVGRVETRRRAGGLVTVITGLRSVTPWLIEVRDVSWNGGTRLAVVGRETQGVMQLRVVDIDGSNMAYLGAPAVDLQRVAAPSPASPEVPMLVADGLGAVWLLGSDNLQSNLGPGSAPVYPG
jgi:hypothetical protein